MSIKSNLISFRKEVNAFIKNVLYQEARNNSYKLTDDNKVFHEYMQKRGIDKDRYRGLVGYLPVGSMGVLINRYFSVSDSLVACQFLSKSRFLNVCGGPRLNVQGINTLIGELRYASYIENKVLFFPTCGFSPGVISGVQARSIRDTDKPKSFNILDKNKNLLHYCIETNIGFDADLRETIVILVEGPFDCLALRSAIIDVVTKHNTGTQKIFPVCTFSANVSEWQIHQIIELNPDKIFILYDSDKAGREGFLRVLKLFDLYGLKNRLCHTEPIIYPRDCKDFCELYAKDREAAGCFLREKILK